MGKIERTIILITILAQCLIVAIAICFSGCETPYVDYGFRPGDLDRIAGANDCITDGFDWICRGPVEYITVEIVRTVKETRTVEVEKVVVKTADPIEIVIREIFLVRVEPDMVIETPVGIIETDAEGNIVAPPEDVNIVPYEPPPPQTDKKPKPQPKNDEMEEVVTNPQPQDDQMEEVVTNPIPQNDEADETEETEDTTPEPKPKTEETEEVLPKPKPPTPQRGNILAYLHQNPQGFWLVGFIHTDYVLLEGNQLTFLGADKVRDADDKTITIREHRYVTESQDPHIVAGELFDTLS